MPLISTIQEGSLGSVAAGAVLSKSIPSYSRFHSLYLECLDSSGDPVSVANIKAEIEWVKFTVDGDEIFNVSPTFLFYLQSFYQGAYNGNPDAGILPYHFVPRNLDSRQAELNFGLGTANVNSIEIQVKMAGSVTNIATVNLFTVRDLVDPNQVAGIHRRLRSYQTDFNSTGNHEYSDLPRPPGIAYKALHLDLMSAPGVIDNHTIRLNNAILAQNVPREANVVTLENSRRIPQAGYYPICFDTGNTIFDALPVTSETRDLRIETNWTTAPGANYRIFAEYFAGYDIALAALRNASRA